MDALPSFDHPQARRLWVITELKLKGSSLSALALQRKVSRSLLDSALDRPNDPAEKIIAESLGVDQKRLFSDRYNGKGQRLYRVRRLVKAAA
jgi:lambda repressor-like predicted transcriptional regulator